VTRLFAVLVFSMILIQSILLPAAVKAEIYACPCVTATTLPATDITPTTATFHGKYCFECFEVVSPLVSARRVDRGDQLVFEYGTAQGIYTHSVEAVLESAPSPDKSDCVIVRANVADLAPCTTYYVRLKVHLSFASAGPYLDGARGAGIGLDFGRRLQLLIPSPDEHCIEYGKEISFRTTGCSIGSGSHQSGGIGSVAPSTRPFILSNIVVQSATVAAARVSPGEKVDVTATVANTGGSNGASKVTLYINGQEAESKGITLSSGESTQVHFSVSQNDPGTYSIYVNGVPAGSFTVDLLTNNDILIYGIIALFTIGIIGVLYLVFKRRVT